MRNRLTAMLGAVALFCASAAHADGYVIKDSNGVVQTMASKYSGSIHYPEHVLFGINAGVPIAVNLDGSGNIGVNVQSGSITCSLCATDAHLSTLIAALGSPFQAGGSIGNTSFGISGTLPAFASTPTVNAAESGTWTVQPGNSANSTPWLMTDSADAAIGAGAAPSKASIGGLVYNASPPAPTTGQSVAMQGDSSGNLLVNLKTALPAGASTIGAVTQASGPWTNNITQFGGSAVVTGTGASGAGIPRVTVSSDSVVGLAAGANTIGNVGQNGTWTVQPGNTANTTPWLTTDSSDAAQVGAGTAPAKASLGALVFNTSPPSLTTGQSVAFQGDSAGNLLVNLKTAIPAGANTIGAVTQASGPWTSNVTQFGGSAVVTGTGAGGSGIPRVTVSNDSVVGLAAGSNVIGAVGNAQASTTSGQSGPLAQCAVTTGAPTYTTAQTDPLSCDTAGNVRVNLLTALPAGTNLIGKAGIDQTTPGTTNGVQDAATSSTGSAAPAKAIYVGANSSGNLIGLIQADSSAAINVSTATTTQIVALSSGKKIYVTGWDVVVAGADNVTLEYGTGSSCGTGTTALTGAYNLPANGGVAKGGGLGPVLVVPASNALCVVTSQAVQASGSISYTQF